MKVKGKILSVSPVTTGVSAKGTEWRRCELIIALEECEGDHEDRVLASAWGTECDAAQQYPLGDKPLCSFDLSFAVRESFGFGGRKYQQIAVEGMEI